MAPNQIENISQIPHPSVSRYNSIYLFTFLAKHSEIIHPPILSPVAYLAFTLFIFKIHFIPDMYIAKCTADDFPLRNYCVYNSLRKK